MEIETVLLFPLFLTAVFGGAVPRLIARARNPADSRTNCAPVGLSCYNCTHPLFCLPTGDSYLVECPDSTPHCNNGGCSSTLTPECETPDGFACTGEDGYYPDPDDCSKYYLCVGGSAYVFTCNTNQVYNHEKSTCVKKKYTSDCAVIKCGSVRPSVVVYPKDNSVYGLCLPNAKTKVFKCPEGHFYDAQKYSCMWKCTKEGRFKYPDDKTKYYECILIATNRYELRIEKCPTNLEFIEEKGYCHLPPSPPVIL